MINIKKILVPTDFSDISASAVGYALSLAKKHDAEVGVLHAMPAKVMREYFSEDSVTGGIATPGDAPVIVRRQFDLDSILERKKRLIQDFLQRKLGPELLKGVKINPLIRFGNAVEEVLAAAKEEQADLIVMTSYGAGLTRLFHASFTERIVRRAPCPVLSIQPSAEVRTEEGQRVAVKLMDKWAA